MAKSTTMSNYNSEILAEANKAGGRHDDLYRDYEMAADTDITSFTPVSSNIEARCIDVGLVERPRNDIVLDKEIKSIKITTNDNKTIFDAEYDIDYYVKPNKEQEDEKVLSKFKRNGEDQLLIAKVTLNEIKSVNHDIMQELNKREDKRTDYLPNGDAIDIIKNFRFINVDEEILQGSTITLEYKFTAINVGEEDYTTRDIANLASGYTDGNKTKTQECELYDLADRVEAHRLSKTSGYVPGEVIGGFYYTGNNEGLVLVKSRIRQVVDYTDADAVFDASYNKTRDNSWRNTVVSELAGNGVSKERLLSKDITALNRLFDKNDRKYTDDSGNHITLSIDEMDEKESNFDNSGFEKELVPVDTNTLDHERIVEADTDGNGEVNGNDNKYTSDLFLVITRTVSSQDDEKNLTFDNVAEIVKSMNTVGRRDIKVVSGNANPKYGEFEIAIKERDSSATEIVTFTPPTGIDMNTNLMNQVLIMTTVGLMIVGAGVIIIKRTMM